MVCRFSYNAVVDLFLFVYTIIASTIPPINITISFKEAYYCISELDGPLQPVLVLSNPSTAEFTVEVTDTDISAAG